MSQTSTNTPSAHEAIVKANAAALKAEALMKKAIEAFERAALDRAAALAAYAIASGGDPLAALAHDAQRNMAMWSGGAYRAMNVAESIRRDSALNMMRDPICVKAGS